MRLLLTMLMLAVLVPPAFAAPKYDNQPPPFLSTERFSTHIIAREFWQTQEPRTWFVACEEHDQPAWALPDTKLGVQLTYDLHRLWKLDGEALHSTRTGKEELGLTLRYCVPLLSGKQYR